MRTAAAILFLTLFLAVPAQAEEARLYKLVDGDSMWLVMRGLRIQVRLAGVDCPEWNQDGGDEAKAFAAQWFERAGETLDVEVRAEQTYDPWNRLVVWVWRTNDNHLLNEDLVRVGAARVKWIESGDQYWERLDGAR